MPPPHSPPSSSADSGEESPGNEPTTPLLEGSEKKFSSTSRPPHSALKKSSAGGSFDQQDGGDKPERPIKQFGFAGSQDGRRSRSSRRAPGSFLQRISMGKFFPFDKMPSFSSKPDEDNSDEEEDDGEAPLWDQFQTIPDDEGDERSCDRFFEVMTKVLKIFMYFVFFVIILGGLLICKACILILTHQIGKAQTNLVSQSRWVYLTCFAVSVPYFINFFYLGLKITFGRHPWPTFGTFVWATFMEAIHTLGLALLCVKVLPQLDLIRSLIIMCGVGTVPSFLNVILGLRPSGGCKKALFIIFDILAFVGQLSAVVVVLLLNYRTDSGSVFFDLANISWETPVCIFCLGFQWRENFYNSDLSCGSATVDITQFKQGLYEARVKLYWMLSIIKCGLVFWFAYLLLLPTGGLSSAFTAFNGTALSQVQNDMSVTTTMTNITNTLTTTVNTTNSMAQSSLPTTIMDTNSTAAPVVRRKRQALTAELNTTITPTAEINTTTTPAVMVCDQHSITDLAHSYDFVPFILLCIMPLIVYYISINAVQLKMQEGAFSIACTLATPIALAIAIALEFTATDANGFLCFFNNTSSTSFLLGPFIVHLVLGVAVWWVSQMWLCRHIWTPQNIRLEKVDGLFVQPIYDSSLMEQSLIYNRRKDEYKWRDRIRVIEDEEDFDLNLMTENVIADSTTPMIYICATMWHENTNEMLQVLKSIFRLDEDQAARRNVSEVLDVTRGTKLKDPDYYEFEAHILFDDAFTFDDNGDVLMNSFVKQLVATVNSSVSSIYQSVIELDPPVKIPTPYGGRLIWTMPGDNKIIAHLKDKNKIRHRKRWSQIMYMYYLLGYKLIGTLDNSGTMSNRSTHSDAESKAASKALRDHVRADHFVKAKVFDDLPEKVILKAENTFCMALDGDVDFKPGALQLLVDRLKRNKKVGVVCGRIHPIGSGPMVWYQKFEYAISHWLQKAAEHVLGCVLCAPGAFSLFRGSALMDDNIMNTYAKLAIEAKDFVQYDQGEDRWLCTLLLQQGYRVEYVAAADALTYAPETFHEFYNQRRRWGPSTMANIVDLLFSWKRTVRMNDNISWLYMLYQGLIFASSILGPATIVLMLTGAFTNVFKLSLAWSYILALGPPVIYLIICFVTKANTQIYIASIMTGIYAVVMVGVLIGTIVEVSKDLLFGPAGIFFALVAGTMVISAILHPQEFTDLFPGLIYFIAIPSGYLLLTIYMLTNMNNVSWGTREVPAKEKPAAAQYKPEQSVIIVKKKAKGGFVQGLLDKQLEEDSLFMKLCNFFKWCCGRANDAAVYDMVKSVHDKLVELEKASLLQGNDMYGFDNNLGGLQNSQYGEFPGLEKQAASRKNSSERKGSSGEQIYASISGRIPPTTEELPETDEFIDEYYQMQHRDDLINPFWAEDACLKHSEVQLLDQNEVTFWKKFIKKYLQPIDKDEAKEKKIADDLKSMRNNVCLAFFLVNALWIATIFMIQFNADDLAKLKIRYNVQGHPQEIVIEPLGLIFLSIFGVTLILQFIGMLWHRWGTLRHIMATTIIDIIPGVNSLSISKRNELQLIMEARKTAKSIGRLALDTYRDKEPDYEPTEEPKQGPLSPGPLSPGDDGSLASGDQHRPRKNTRTRLSIRKNFRRNLDQIVQEAAQSNVTREDNETANGYVDLEAPATNGPPLPKRKQFGNVTRKHTVNRVKRLQSLKKNRPAGDSADQDEDTNV